MRNANPGIFQTKLVFGKAIQSLLKNLGGQQEAQEKQETKPVKTENVKQAPAAKADSYPNQYLVRLTDEALAKQVGDFLRDHFPGVSGAEVFRQAIQFAMDNAEAFVSGTPVAPDASMILASAPAPAPQVAPAAVLERRPSPALLAQHERLVAATSAVFADQSAPKVSHQIAFVGRSLADMILEANK